MTASSHVPTLPNVRPLRRLHVLVATTDARYARVACFLLERAGFDAESCREEETLARVESNRRDVVVLDASRSFGAAARLRAALVVRHRHVAVVLVSDSPRAFASFGVLPKWHRGETLTEEVERAYLRLSSDGDALLAAD